MNWQKSLSRLSIPGLVLLALGAVVCTQANKLLKSERLILAARIAGIVLALAGTLILLDFIPGL
ncbi:MAG: hypothetical protein IKJ26_07265 [Clostridia bacterium]|nr:hypothetical protein [Clostridia bacterium]